MLKNILATGAVIAVLPFFVTPSFALKGIEALDQCVQNTLGGCRVLSSPAGDIRIDGGAGGTLHCPSLEEDCIVVGKEVKGARKTEYQVPESLTSGGGNSGDTGVPGTGSGGGDPGPVTPVSQ